MKQYYLYNNRVADVSGAKAVADIAHGGSSMTVTPAVPQGSATPAVPSQVTASSSQATASSASPAYLRRPNLPSTRVELGKHHPGKDITNPKSRIFFTDLELGYIGWWIRQDTLNMQKYRLLPEVIGDNMVSRSVITLTPYYLYYLNPSLFK